MVTVTAITLILLYCLVSSGCLNPVASRDNDEIVARPVPQITPEGD